MRKLRAGVIRGRRRSSPATAARGEVVERTFAATSPMQTGGMRRVWVRGHENVRISRVPRSRRNRHCNIGLLLRNQPDLASVRPLDSLRGAG